MKKIVLLLLVIAGFFLAKLLPESLGSHSLFFSFGCNSRDKHYSAFLNVGCKEENLHPSLQVGNSTLGNPQQIVNQNLTSSLNEEVLSAEKEFSSVVDQLEEMRQTAFITEQIPDILELATQVLQTEENVTICQKEIQHDDHEYDTVCLSIIKEQELDRLLREHSLEALSEEALSSDGEDEETEKEFKDVAFALENIEPSTPSIEPVFDLATIFVDAEAEREAFIPEAIAISFEEPVITKGPIPINIAKELFNLPLENLEGQQFMEEMEIQEPIVFVEKAQTTNFPLELQEQAIQSFDLDVIELELPLAHIEKIPHPAKFTSVIPESEFVVQEEREMPLDEENQNFETLAIEEEPIVLPDFMLPEFGSLIKEVKVLKQEVSVTKDTLEANDLPNQIADENEAHPGKATENLETITPAPIEKIVVTEEPKKEKQTPAVIVEKQDQPEPTPVISCCPSDCAPVEIPCASLPKCFPSDCAASTPQPPCALPSLQETSCCPNRYPVPKLITVRHIEGINDQETCVPLATNYSTLTMFLAPDYSPGEFLPGFDLRGHRFDHGSYAANLGFVGRFIPDFCSDFCNILGFNMYYDYRQACLGYFQQAGFGLEILGNRWDLRGNLYVPFGSKNHHKQCIFDDYIGDYFLIQDIYESVSYSFNAEIGYYLMRSRDFFLYVAGGPYYISGRKCVDKTRGGEVRFRPQYKDYIALDFSYRYDSLFESVWQAEISIQLPLYKLKNQNLRPCCLSDWQIYQPVQRFEVMPVGMRHCWQSNF